MAGINRNFDSNVSHLDSHFNELQCFFDMEAGGTFVWLPESVEPMRLLAFAGICLLLCIAIFWALV